MLTFRLEIVTPERIAFSEEVESITAPSSTGQITILPHHIPLFTLLSAGEVKIIAGNEELYLAIGSGFLEVTNEKTLLLVTSAIHADEINEEEVLEAQKRAKEAIEKKPEGAALLEAQALFRRSSIAIQVSRRRKRRRV